MSDTPNERREIQHPLTTVRKELGLTRREFALMSGSCYQDVYLVETGYRASIPRRLLNTVTNLGYDAHSLQDGHQRYLKALGAEAWKHVAIRGPAAACRNLNVNKENEP